MFCLYSLCFQYCDCYIWAGNAACYSDKVNTSQCRRYSGDFCCFENPGEGWGCVIVVVCLPPFLPFFTWKKSKDVNANIGEDVTLPQALIAEILILIILRPTARYVAINSWSKRGKTSRNFPQWLLLGVEKQCNMITPYAISTLMHSFYFDLQKKKKKKKKTNNSILSCSCGGILWEPIGMLCRSSRYL